jgi:hypothetical protein
MVEFFLRAGFTARIQFGRSALIIRYLSTAKMNVIIPIPVVGRQILLRNVRLELFNNLLHNRQPGTKVGVYALGPVGGFGVQAG